MMSIRNSDGTRAGARAARAHELMAAAAEARDLLEFYAALVEYQQRLVERSPGAANGAASAASLLGAVDAAWVGRAVRDLVIWLPAVAPPALRASAEALGDVAEEEWRELFEAYRASPGEAAARFSDTALFALEAVLQPVAERLAAGRRADAAASTTGFARAASTSAAEHTSPPGGESRDGESSGGGTPARCPACGGAPLVGVLREAGHGARRRLVCGLCLTEWDHLRVVCVKCGEQRFDALPVFSAEQFPHARVDACDTCRSYLKTIDATRDGRASPVVDDLATVALDLWAREQGYTRVRANLARI